MTNQPFGQQPAFGAAPASAQQAPLEEEPTRSNKTVVIAVAAGVVALGVLGGAAALVLGGGGDTDDLALPPAPATSVEPVVPTTAPPSPLPTAAVQGRNVFVPLGEDGAGEAAAGGAVGDVETAATPAPVKPTGAVGTIIGLPGPTTGSSLPLPAVTVTETVSVPGPATTVPGPTTTVPGPTTTVSTPAETVQVAIPGADFGSLEVSVREDAGTTPSSFPATFEVTFGEDEPFTFVDRLPGQTFGPDGDEFHYVSYADGTLTFRYVSSMLSIQVVPVP